MSSSKKGHLWCGPQKRTILVVGGFLLSACVGGAAWADTSLFTTQDDWNQWASASAGIGLAAGAAGDTDLTSINGLGNATAPQQAGTAGGTTVTISSGQTYGSFLSPGEQANAAFLSTLSSAPTLQMDFTYPTGGGTYFDPQLLLNYSGHYVAIDATNVANPGTYWTATYQVPAGLPSAPSPSLTYFQLGFIANTNQTGSFIVDNVIAQAPTNVTTLFTSNSDWGQWSAASVGITAAAGASGDTDGNPTTSLGNTLYGPGHRDLAGGLTVTIAPGPGHQTYGSVVSADEHNNATLLTALAAASTLQLDFTYPVFNGSYFQPLLLLNFDGHYDQIAPNSVLNNGTYSTALYSLPAGLPTDPNSLSYFQIGVIANTDETGAFTIDNMEIITAVPEPASIFLLAFVGAGLVRRSARSQATAPRKGVLTPLLTNLSGLPGD